MQGIGGLAGSVAVLVWASVALADEALTVAGRQISVTEDGMGSATLAVDGVVMHENGVIYIDPEPQVVAGVTVLTGAAGAGGNACNAAPFVLALPESGAPKFWGPIDSCTYLVPDAQNSRVLFVSESSSNVSGRIRPDEVWMWTPSDGFTTPLGSADVGSTAAPGWEGLEGLAGAHPVEALKITPLMEALQAGFGEDYARFAERISDLGSGDLTEKGYLGQACLKFTCEEDWAFLYIDRATQTVFAAWNTSGETDIHRWPEDTKLWPEEALTALGERSAG
ncbi:hypothetical protein [Tabrizicola sp.]|uniref:hypothetical protein n=1 Tax=Tabrizicola sp. TaxID=2005166 RepID=UPI003F2C3570